MKPSDLKKLNDLRKAQETKNKDPSEEDAERTKGIDRKEPNNDENAQGVEQKSSQIDFMGSENKSIGSPRASQPGNKSIGRKKNKMLKRAVTMKAAETGAKGGAIYAGMRMAKSFFNSMVGAVKSAIKGIGGKILGGLKSFGSAIVGGAKSAFSAVTGFFGSTTTLTAAEASALITAIILTSTFIPTLAGVLGDTPKYRSGKVIDCRDDLKMDKLAADILNQNADAMKKQVASRIYGVFHRMGYTDAQIAGMLGNFDAETGIDPTVIEGYYKDSYQMSPKKMEIAQDLDRWARSTLFPKYRASGVNFNPRLYLRPDGHTYSVGIGLGQITGSTRFEKFYTTAQQVGKNWWDLDYQIAYYLTKDDRSKWLTEWKDKQTEDVEQARYEFSKYWEGNLSNGQDTRKKQSRYWYEQIRSGALQDDAQFSESVLALADEMGVMAIDGAASKALEECQTALNYNNSSIALAACSLSFPTIAQSRSGITDTYKKIKPLVFPEDDPNFYKSCDRGSGTAIRWAGADDTFPVGPTSAQWEYAIASEKWQELGQADSVDPEPGDVGIKPKGRYGSFGHIFVYVGYETAYSVFGDAMGVSPGTPMICHASYGTRTMGCGPNVYKKGSKTAYQYTMFRNVQPESNSKYKDVGGGSNANAGGTAF